LKDSKKQKHDLKHRYEAFYEGGKKSIVKVSRFENQQKASDKSHLIS